MEPVSNQTKQSENVWDRRDDFPAVSLAYKLVAVLVCFLCAVSVPLCSSELWSLAILAALFAFAVWMVRAPFGLILLLVSAFAAIGMGIRLGAGAVVLALALGAASFAFLFTVLKQRYLAFLPIVAAIAVAFFLLEEPVGCLLCLAYLPAALLLAAATLLAKRRTTAICFAAGGFLAIFLALLCVLVYRAYGALRVELILQYIESTWRGLYDTSIQIQEQLLRGMDPEDEAAKLLREMLAKARAEETVALLFATFSKMLPAYAIVACSILAFAAQALLNAFYATAGLHCVLDRNARIFTVSLSAAVLYTLSFLLMMFLPESSMVTAVAQNLALILLPGLCVLGTIRILAILSNLKGGARLGLLAVVILILSLAADSALLLLAMWGAYSNISAAIHYYMLKKMLERHNDRNHKDD